MVCVVAIRGVGLVLYFLFVKFLFLLFTITLKRTVKLHRFVLSLFSLDHLVLSQRVVSEVLGARIVLPFNFLTVVKRILVMQSLLSVLRHVNEGKGDGEDYYDDGKCDLGSRRALLIRILSILPNDVGWLRCLLNVYRLTKQLLEVAELWYVLCDSIVLHRSQFADFVLKGYEASDGPLHVVNHLLTTCSFSELPRHALVDLFQLLPFLFLNVLCSLHELIDDY